MYIQRRQNDKYPNFIIYKRILGNSNRITSISFNIYLLLDITFHFIILIYFSYLNRSNSKKKRSSFERESDFISKSNQLY